MSRNEEVVGRRNDKKNDHARLNDIDKRIGYYYEEKLFTLFKFFIQTQSKFIILLNRSEFNRI